MITFPPAVVDCDFDHLAVEMCDWSVLDLPFLYAHRVRIDVPPRHVLSGDHVYLRFADDKVLVSSRLVCARSAMPFILRPGHPRDAAIPLPTDAAIPLPQGS